METYPIPADDSAYSDLLKRLTLQREVLQSPIAAIADQLGKRLTDQEKAIKSVSSRLNRVVNAGLKSSSNLLQSVTDPVLTNIATNLGENGIKIGSVLLDAPTASTSDIMCPPGYVNPVYPNNNPAYTSDNQRIGQLVDIYVRRDPCEPQGIAVTTVFSGDGSPTGGDILMATGLTCKQAWDFCCNNYYNGILLNNGAQYGWCSNPSSDDWQPTKACVNPPACPPPPPCPPSEPCPPPPPCPPGEPCPPVPPCPPPPPPPPCPPTEPCPPVPPVYPPVCPPTEVTCPAPAVTCPTPVINVNVPPPVYPPYPPSRPPTDGGGGTEPPGVTDGGGTGGGFASISTHVEYVDPGLFLPPVPKTALIPLPGTREWCRNMDMIVESLNILGTSIFQYFHNITKLENLIGTWQAVSGSMNLIPGFDQIGQVITWMINADYRIADTELKQVAQMTEYLQYIAGLTSPCGISQIFGITMVKSMLRAFQKLRIGTDLFVWLTFDLEVDLGLLERLVDYVINYVCQTTIPSPPEAMEAFIRDTIPRDLYECWMKNHGCNPDVFEPVLQARREQPTPQEYMFWCRRNNIPLDQENILLRQRGFTDGMERKMLQDLYWELPTINDHLHWLQRNVFDTRYVEDFQLMEGFDAKFWPKFGPDLTALGMKEEYARLHYAAHWINPSAGQLFEMVQRLRPDRVSPDVQFTTDDCLRILVEQDTGIYFRKRLLMIAYKTFGLRFLRQMYDTYELSDYELGQRFQDIGYKPEDADILVASEKKSRAWRRSTRTKGWSPTAIAWAVQRDLITDGDAARLMQALYFNDDEIHDLIQLAHLKGSQGIASKCRQKTLQEYEKQIEDSYKTGTVSRDDVINSLTAMGYTNECSQTRADTVDLKIETEFAKKHIAGIKKQYMRGIINIAGAMNALVGAGVSGQRANQYINAWGTELTPERKTATAQKVALWYQKGLIDQGTAYNRLRNLGYDDPDSVLFVAEANRAILEAEVKRIQVANRMIEQRRKELERLAKANEAQARRIQSEYRTMYPYTKLQAWLKEGIISEDVMRLRMRRGGYSLEAINNYVAEVYAKMGESTNGKVKETSEGTSGSSPTS